MPKSTLASQSTATADRRQNSVPLDKFWMPFTANRTFKAAPRLLASAQGMYYTADDGRKVLDGTSGLWCVNAGHGRKEIAEAVSRQLMTLDYAPTFQMGHPIAFEFAERLVATVAPKGLDRVFFAGSGSEAVDSALKIAFAYQRARGRSDRNILVGRDRGYHGVGFGGISVGGLPNNKRAFPTLANVDHLRHTHDLARNAFSRGIPAHGVEFADDLERLVALHGADAIAAVIVEPMAGSAGVLPAPKGYLQRLRALCTKYDILLIFDEVITGFGRLGAPFGADFYGVTPDIMTTAKGLTNGAIPMGATFVRSEICDTVIEKGAPGAIEFFHGYTYSGHPVASAAGLATLDIYEDEQLLTRGAALGPYFEDAVHSLRSRRNVIDIRNLGLVAGIELAPRPDKPGARAYDAFVDCFERGLLVRATGDIIALSPPLIIEREQIDTMVSMLGDAIDRAA